MHYGSLQSAAMPRQVEVKNHDIPFMWIGVKATQHHIRWTNISVQDSLRQDMTAPDYICYFRTNA